MYTVEINKTLLDEDIQLLLNTDDYHLFLETEHNVSKEQYCVYIKKCCNTILRVGIRTISSAIVPSCIIGDSVVFIGFDYKVIVCNLKGNIIGQTDFLTAFFEFQIVDDIVVGIFEAEICFFDKVGCLLKKSPVPDIITNIRITPDKEIHLDLYEGDEIIFNLSSM